MKHLIYLLIPVATSRLYPQTNFSDLVIEKNVVVSMRDGVVLRADVLRPRKLGKFPVPAYRTPYGKELALKNYTTFRKAVQRGYAVVVEEESRNRVLQACYPECVQSDSNQSSHPQQCRPGVPR